MGIRAFCLALVVAAAAMLGVPPGAAGASTNHEHSSHLTTLKIVLAWYPTSEYGGLYAALQQGYFKKEGINLHIQNGGPNVSPTSILGSGRAQIGYTTNTETLLLARQDGIPLTEFATTFQIYPQGVIYKQAKAISTFSEMQNKVVSDLAGTATYEWLSKKYHLNDTQVPYTVSTLAHGKATFLIGFITDTLPALQQQGIKVGYRLIQTSGLDPYADILVGLHSYVTSHRKLLRRFDGALARGWQYWQSHYKSVTPLIHRNNPATPIAIQNAIAKLETGFVFGRRAATAGIGTITARRVESVYKKYRSVKIVTKSFKISTLVTTHLMPKVLPLRQAKHV